MIKNIKYYLNNYNQMKNDQKYFPLFKYLN